jgi:copper chaperone NosL
MEEAPPVDPSSSYRMIRSSLFAIAVPILMTLVSCAQKVPTIDYGQAECAHCRMNVVDERFAAAIITKAGRQYVFDGAECMVPFVASGSVAEEQVAGWYVCDHAHPGDLLDATKAFYVHGPAFRSPMRGDVAAFVSEGERDAAQDRDGGEPLNWEQAKVLLQK